MKFDSRGIGYTTEQAAGAIPNGRRVEKINDERGDTHKTGDQAKVIGSMSGVIDGKKIFGYFVIWDDVPDIPVFIAGYRIRELS